MKEENRNLKSKTAQSYDVNHRSKTNRVIIKNINNSKQSNTIEQIKEFKRIAAQGAFVGPQTINSVYSGLNFQQNLEYQKTVQKKTSTYSKNRLTDQNHQNEYQEG